MKVQIINKRVTVILISMLFIVIFKINNIYSSKIDSLDTEKYSVCSANYMALYAPNRQYNADIDVCKKDKNSEVSYIRGVLFIPIEGEKVTKFWKYFYLEKVLNTDLEVVNEDGYEKCKAEWIDNQHLLINGRKVNIYEGYDYRNENN